MNTDLIGTRLGKYEIQTEIGRGGMGAVYKGYDPTLDRYVAVKVLAPHLVWEKGFVERFLREARAAARLKHSNIVTIYDVGQEGGWYYFVMEYLEGQTLTEIIRQRRPLPPDEVLSILHPLAKALDYAHHRGLVHRDIKPGNIVVDLGGQATLTDFGIARAAQETRMTAMGTLVGTPEYMSPEQAKGLTVDVRSDQYSLGVMAYEMLSGRAPFQAESTLALLHKIVYDPLPPIRQERPDLPIEVEGALTKVLAKEPGDRYATVSAFVDALGRALAGEAVGEMAAQPQTIAPPVESPTVVREPEVIAASAPVTPSPAVRPAALAPRRVSVWVWAIGGLAVLALVAAVVVGVGKIGMGGIEDGFTSTPPTEQTATVVVPEGVEETTNPSPSPSPKATAARTPTVTPARTSTTVPTHTPRPTATPTPIPQATPTPVPRATAPELMAPALGGEFKSPVTFQWSGSLGGGQAYQVTAYHPVSGHVLQSALLATRSWTADLPGDQVGEWRWVVSVIQGGSTVVTSSEWMFWFDPISGSGEKKPGPAPEPTSPLP